MHGNEDGSVPATFQIIYMVSALLAASKGLSPKQYPQIGWKPSPTQPKPLERGAGKVNLKEVL